MLRSADGEAVYRRCTSGEHHHHLVCRSCGRTVEVAGPGRRTVGREGRRRARLRRGEPHPGGVRHLRRLRRARGVRLSRIGGGGTVPTYTWHSERECQPWPREVSRVSTTASSRSCAPSSRTTSPPTSRWAPRRWSSGTTWVCRRRRSATTWRRWRTRATSPSRTPAPAASPPTRATGCSSTGSRRSSRCPRAERRAIQTFLDGAVDLDDVVGRTVRLLAQLTRQVAVVQYPSLTRSQRPPRRAGRPDAAPAAARAHHQHRPGRAAGGRAPGAVGRRACVGELRALLNAAVDGVRARRRARPADRPARRFAAPDAARGDRRHAGAAGDPGRAAARSAWSWRGAANLARFGPDFPQSIRPVLEALEEQVVLLRLLGEATDPSALTVRIGDENPFEGLTGTSVVSVGYGSDSESLARLGVLGPTRMDYPGTMGAVRAVARYVGKIAGGVAKWRLTTTAPSACARDATTTRSRRPTAGWPASCTPTSTPTRDAGALQGGHPGLRGAVRPAEAQMYDLGADPLLGGRRPAVRRRASAFSDIMDAFFGGAAARPRPRVRAQRRGRRRADPGRARPAETAFGTTRELPVDTAVVCATCAGQGTAPGTRPDTCDMCHGRGEVQQVTRSFLGQVMTTRPCPACGGFGIDHPAPLRRVLRRRPGPHPPDPQGQDPGGRRDGTRIQLAGEGEVGPGGGPAGDLFVEIVERRHHASSSARRRPALHGRRPDDGGRARHHARAGDARRRRALDIRPGTQSGQVLTLPGRGVQHLRGTGRGDLHRPRRRADADPPRRASRRSCCASSPRCAARSGPAARSRAEPAGCSPGCATRSTGAERERRRCFRLRAGALPGRPDRRRARRPRGPPRGDRPPAARRESTST